MIDYQSKNIRSQLLTVFSSFPINDFRRFPLNILPALLRCASCPDVLSLPVFFLRGPAGPPVMTRSPLSGRGSHIVPARLITSKHIHVYAFMSREAELSSPNPIHRTCQDMTIRLCGAGLLRRGRCMHAARIALLLQEAGEVRGWQRGGKMLLCARKLRGKLTK
jgi:hypothetical protein